MAAPVLAVEGVSKRFATNEGPIHALDDVSFDLAAGEVHILAGENGAGKKRRLMNPASSLQQDYAGPGKER